ncbi:DUF2141 domain-containing protein [Bacteroidota bacterium]
MKGNVIRVLGIFFLLSSPLHAQQSNQRTGKLIITFTNIRSDVGNIAMGFYNDARQWTDDPISEHRWPKRTMRNGKLTVEIPDLPYDTYACAVLDDEDRSRSMEYFLGLPKEGWGMSTNPPFLKLKKPGFDEVSFKLDRPVVRIEIKMNYLNKNKKVE